MLPKLRDYQIVHLDCPLHRIRKKRKEKSVKRRKDDGERKLRRKVRGRNRKREIECQHREVDNGRGWKVTV